MGLTLSNIQKKAVEYEDGALLVVAGPGSGKTRILTERIRRILKDKNGHFRLLALTFTNKAANEMKERLRDLDNILERAFIGTIHSFCMEVLAQRGKPVGIDGLPQIFHSYQDRRQVLLQAINDDPYLLHELKGFGGLKEQNEKIDEWMRKILIYKSRLLNFEDIEEDVDRRIYESYNAGLRASGAVDFDDLLFLTYRLFEERPKIAAFYRRLYRYIFIDEAQDLNPAQYGVINALCGDEFRNVMMVGDPKQSIYGFNTADPKLMYLFKEEFDANVLEMNENYRSSKAIVGAAKSLNPFYEVQGIIPIEGLIKVIQGKDEQQEAQLVLDTLRDLLTNGHPDIETPFTLERCAILGRTRYTLLSIEEELRKNNLSYYKQLSSSYESESDLLKEYELCLRLMVNPKDRLHLEILKKRWKGKEINIPIQMSGLEIIQLLSRNTISTNTKILVEAAEALDYQSGNFKFYQAINILEQYANTLEQDDKRAIWEDIQVLRGEWDRYVRAEIGGQSDPASFLVHMALGTTQQPRQDGLALLTVHSSKGLEFDVVFIVGMSDGTFPDYRAKRNSTAMAEERRNAFVAVTRSKRLLFLSYPKTKRMPWGDIWTQQPSQFLKDIIH